MRFKQLVYFTFLVVFLSSSFVQALSVKSLTLKQMVALSTRIANVTVTDTRIEEDENGHIVQYITCDVNEWLEGDGGPTLVYKQIANVSESADINLVSKNGTQVPVPQKGHTYLLFLGDDSEKTGLVAPIGLYQGQIELKNVNGEVTAPGLSANKSLVKSVQAKGLSKPLSDGERALLGGSEKYNDLKAAIQAAMAE